MSAPPEQPPPRQLLGTVMVLGSGTALRLQVEHVQFGLSASDTTTRATEAAAMFDALSVRVTNSQAEQLQQHFLAFLEQKRDYEQYTAGLREQVQSAIKLRRRDDLVGMHAVLDRTAQVSARVTQRIGELQRLIEDILASPSAHPPRHGLQTGAAPSISAFPAQLERRVADRRSSQRDSNDFTLRSDRRSSRLASVLGTSVTLTGRGVICRLEARSTGRIVLSMDTAHAVTLIDAQGADRVLTPDTDGSVQLLPPEQDAQLLVGDNPGHAIALHRSL